MRLRRRIVNTVLWNVALFLVPWWLYQASHWISIWGAYRGWWPLVVTFGHAL
jgi:hypothetical protein